LTTLIEKAATSNNVPEAMIIFPSNSQIKNLTLNANNVALPFLVWGRFDTNVNFTNVTLNAGLNQTFDIHGDQLISFTDCTVIGNYAFMGTASQVFISGTHFYGTNDAVMMLYSWGGSDISITGCTAQALNPSDPTDPDGWSDGRFFVGTALWGSEHGLYFADNQTIDLGVRPDNATQNSGEQYLWEGQSISSTYVPTNFSATGNTLTVPGLSSSFPATNYEAIVVAGDGVGEHVAITGFNAATGVLTLAGPWAVIPDSSSVIRFGEVADDVVVYQNQIQGAGVTNTASCGVQAGGGTFNFIIDSNTISNVRYAIEAGGPDDGNNVLPDYNILVENNIITNTQLGIDFGNNGMSGQTAAVGLVARYNQINTASVEGFLLVETDDAGANRFLPILEGNTVTNAPVGISVQQLGGPSIDLVLDNNTFTEGSNGAPSSIAVDAGQQLIINGTGNSFTGFGEVYGGVYATTFKASLASGVAPVIGSGSNGSTSTPAPTAPAPAPIVVAPPTVTPKAPTSPTPTGNIAVKVPTAAQLAPPPGFVARKVTVKAAASNVALQTISTPNAVSSPSASLSAAVEYQLALDMIGLLTHKSTDGNSTAAVLTANESAILQTVEKELSAAAAVLK
jgi:hypothetical protein